MFNFRSADWPENYFSGQSAGRGSNTSSNKCPRGSSALQVKLCLEISHRLAVALHKIPPYFSRALLSFTCDMRQPRGSSEISLVLCGPFCGTKIEYFKPWISLAGPVHNTPEKFENENSKFVETSVRENFANA